MRDCPNLTMREQLPELLHGRLTADARAAVEQHVAGCAECAAELELLREIRATAVAPYVDVARIAAAVPPYAAHVSIVTRGISTRSWLRVAAAVVLVAGAATLWKVARRVHTPVPPAPVATVDVDSGARPVSPQVTPLAPAAPVARVAQLSLGEPLSDLSDGDLRALAESVGTLDVALSADVESAEPILIDPEGDS